MTEIKVFWDVITCTRTDRYLLSPSSGHKKIEEAGSFEMAVPIYRLYSITSQKTKLPFLIDNAHLNIFMVSFDV
jgi:hypothetical protein